MSYQTCPQMLGVIMLSTRFPRLVGDIGNPETFPFPVIYERVQSATVSRIVSGDDLPESMLEKFCEKAAILEKRGATLISTSCGFLAPAQAELQSSVTVPVMTSSLLMLPWLRSVHPGSIGVMTFDADKLSHRHCADLAESNVMVGGIRRDGVLARTIEKDLNGMDAAAAESESVADALALVQRRPDVNALLLECTNLSPYREAISVAAGLPVYDLNRALIWMISASDKSPRS